MRRYIAPIAAAIAVAFAGTASAQRYASYDYAQVVRVDPIVEYVSEPVRRQECWQEPVVYEERRYGGRSDRAPAVLGAVVGGALGNQIGSGRGRDAATVAGAALGYSIARDAQRDRGYYGTQRVHGYEQRCTTRTDYRSDERVLGYNVTYRYNGRLYNTRTDYHPGTRMRVRLDLP